MTRWGILGTGFIAGAFAAGLTALDDAEILAVGSRTQAAADVFANKFNIPRQYPSYKALADDPDVEVIYVSTPHSLHCENTLLCLDAGKAVLCEKPFAINTAQADTMIQKAREKRLFLMEAMWTRFLPVLVRVRELLANGAIGEPRMINADFGFRTNFNPAGRLFDPNLGGGGLLDVGIYPLSLASMVFGNATRISSMATLGETGVDEQSAFILGYEDGQLAVLSTAIRTNTPQTASIIGTEGYIRIHSPWWRGTTFTLSVQGKSDEVFECPLTGNGYNYQAAEVVRCLREGKLESDVMPLDETRSIMATMDSIRAQWGLKYPME
jgi:predicted dehydrogenase